jgi:hypothetical protein
LVVDDKFEIDSSLPHLKNTLQLTFASENSRSHLTLENYLDRGFHQNMFVPYPRKKLGIHLRIENLALSKSRFYFVEMEEFKKFFGPMSLLLDKTKTVVKRHQHLLLQFKTWPQGGASTRDDEISVLPVGKVDDKEIVIIQKFGGKNSFKNALDQMTLNAAPEENKRILKEEFIYKHNQKDEINKFIRQIQQQDIIKF